MHTRYGHSECNRRIWRRTRDTLPARADTPAGFRRTRPDRHHPAAFTLIELLVVISILVLLMAILIPTLTRVRNQARAMVCQAHLRQWGHLFQTRSLSDPEVPLFHPEDHESVSLPAEIGAVRAVYAEVALWQQRYAPAARKLFLCPMASRPASQGSSQCPPYYYGVGGSTFSAWWMTPSATLEGTPILMGSYTPNQAVTGGQVPRTKPIAEVGWYGPLDVREGPSVPVFTDCALWRGRHPEPSYGPPPFEDTFTCENWSYFINRHNGGTNSLFLDSSVRQVGLKELFTLKWHKSYNKANTWTKAGGVQPGDWPVWMRKFKDY